MFGAYQQPASSMLDELIQYLSSLAQGCGLHTTSDAPAPAASFLPIDAEGLDELRAEPGWNDQPIVERVLRAMLRKGKSVPQERRLLVLLPDMRVVVVIAASFMSVTNTLDVTKTGVWSLSFSVKGGTPCNGMGQLVKDADELGAMLGVLKGVFENLQKAHEVPARAPRQGLWDGMQISGPTGLPIGGCAHERQQAIADGSPDGRRMCSDCGEVLS